MSSIEVDCSIHDVTFNNVTCSDNSAFSSLDNVSWLLYSDG